MNEVFVSRQKVSVTGGLTKREIEIRLVSWCWRGQRYPDV